MKIFSHLYQTPQEDIASTRMLNSAVSLAIDTTTYLWTTMEDISILKMVTLLGIQVGNLAVPHSTHTNADMA